jgi:ABC-type branched-subunit amino acid transport system ATPase component/branched-subunit amino acid ABC-type transport system permease component
VDQHLINLLLGLANGALYAALALTLVVTYRSSGVLNFATGAMALLGAYFYSFLRTGKLFIPLPWLPKTVSIGGALSFWPAAIIAVLLCAVVGLLLYLAVFRPLRGVSPLGKAVASVGVMVVLTGLFHQRAGTTAITTEPVLPQSSWKIGKVFVPQDRVWFAVIVLGITFALAAAYRFTRFGLLTRAAAETEKGAFVSGIEPDRIAAANWMISAGVAGVSGILIASILSPAPDNYTLYVVPALAAAVLGQFQFMVPAVLGGLAIGMVQSEAQFLIGQQQQHHSWLPTSGIAEVVPLVLILLLLVARAKPLPSRGAVILQSLGRAPRPRAVGKTTLIWTAAGVVALFALQGEWRGALIMSFILAMITLSLVVVTGFAGQVSLAQLTLAGVAAFVLGTFTTHYNLPFPLGPILAALISAAVGVLIGLPALRIRGLPVAVVTLAAAVALEAVWFRSSTYAGTNGKDVAGPKLFGLDLRARVGTDINRWQFGLLTLAVLVLIAFVVAKLRTSSLGSQMLAVRANERSAAGAGINVVRTKLIAFALAAGIAGLGGSMLGYYQANVTFVSFTTLVGLGLFTQAYLAGITSVSGGIVAGFIGAGGIFALVISKWAHVGGDYYATLSGIGLIFTVIKNPEGIVGPVHDLLERRRQRKSGSARSLDLTALEAHLEPMDPVQGGEVVLSATNIRVQYGGVVAVDDATIEVRKGTIVGLIGPNGAGKTTLLDAMSGFARSSGSVVVCGQNVTKLPPFQRVRASLGRTFQHTELYEDLTVTENVIVGAAAAHGRQPKTVPETLELLGLSEVAERPVGELSQGRRQLVSIARALIGNPDVLLLDEPAGGLDSRESQWLGLRLRRIRDSGVSILLIDHDMHLVLNLCDSIYVLNFGKIIAAGAPAAIRTNRSVAAAYLGSAHAEQEVMSS